METQLDPKLISHSDPYQRKPKLPIRRWLSKAMIHIPLVLCALLMIFPFFWMLSTSLKSPGQQFIFPPKALPAPLYWQNYVDLFALANMGQYLFNSTKIAVLSTIGMCLSSSLAGFAFARLRFPGKEIVFSLLLATLMLPGAVVMVPTFLIIRTLGWIDNHAALIVPSFFGGAFSVFLLRQSYRGIPQELVDAATIDGASLFRIYWQLFIPLGMPALATVAIFNFLGSWNDLLGPLIYLNTTNKMTLTLALTFLRGRSGSTAGHLGVEMAGALLGVIPMLILYFIGQKYFIQGLARMGLKG
jgi:multiple sugar transport system permease protein